MRFLVRKDTNKVVDRRRKYRWLKHLLTIFAIANLISNIWLYLRQEQLLYQPNKHLSLSTPQDFQLAYQNVWIDNRKSKAPVDARFIYPWYSR